MDLDDRKIWLLIIDDNKVTRKLFAHQLHKEGFHIISAEDGEEAMEILKYCTPDCILGINTSSDMQSGVQYLRISIAFSPSSADIT